MPLHLHLVHINYIILGVAFPVLLVFLWKKWDFVALACSDKGSPSATRICGFIFTLCVVINETFTTMRTQKFDTDHLHSLLIAIGVLFGIIKVTEIMSFFTRSAPPAATTTTTQTTVAAEQKTITETTPSTEQPA